jgi:hypothetical protein
LFADNFALCGCYHLSLDADVITISLNADITIISLDVDVIIHIMIKSEYIKPQVTNLPGDDNIPKEHWGNDY